MVGDWVGESNYYHGSNTQLGRWSLLGNVWRFRPAHSGDDNCGLGLRYPAPAGKGWL